MERDEHLFTVREVPEKPGLEVARAELPVTGDPLNGQKCS